VRLKFNASDSIHTGEYLDGGSLIEAAVDDIQLWVNAEIVGIPEHGGPSGVSIYPDPTSDVLNVAPITGSERIMGWAIIDATGRVVMASGENGAVRNGPFTITVRDLGPGAYVLRLQRMNSSEQYRFQVAR
ncbi:MAG TPA: T9SS type A sorting domain-containing protein, partial [Flavobacteriales bacterium]|nr:T9SS type A sorting domain-containing protein [Flavobacteriales bacterium]